MVNRVKLICVMCSMFAGVFLLSSQVFADAKSDCRIQTEKAPDGSCNYVYVMNTNTGRRVEVTVGITERSAGSTRTLPDKVLTLAAGERASLGSDKSGDATYTHTVKGASYK
jgi:hypothetical protein